MANARKQYNEIYRKHKRAFGGGRPDTVVEEILKYKSHGTVIEFGAGQGRNALFLAAHGFGVTAADVSPVAVKAIEEQAQKQGLKVKTAVLDVTGMKLEHSYDVVVSTFMLHHLTKSQALIFIEKIQNHTNSGGLNVLTAFTAKGDLFDYEQNKNRDRYLPYRDELKELYGNWEVCNYSFRKSRLLQKKQDGGPMLNMTVSLLAQRGDD